MRAGFGVAALIAATLAAGGLHSPADDLVGTTARIDTVDVPTEAVFRIDMWGDSDGNTLVGAVHAVNRVDGGTVLYYSAAVSASGGAGEEFATSSTLFSGSGTQAEGIALVAPQAGMVYEPLVLSDGDIASSSNDAFQWNNDSQRLLVGYAVFPELPEDVSEVYVRIGAAGQTADRPVPVGQGVLSPAVDDVLVELGSGWPRIPQGDELAGTDPGAHTFPIYYRTNSDDGTASTLEGGGEVVTTLASDVLFAKDSADLSSDAQATLDVVASDLADRGTGVVTVTGHTDSDGTDEYNMDLSRRRAQAVVDALTPGSGTKVSFEVVAMGESSPVATNSTPEGQQANRRVTVAYEVSK